MAYTAENYPAFAGSAAVAGKKFLLYVAYSDKWNLIGGLRDTSLEISADSIDASSKDNGGWGESLPGPRSWTASPSIVVKNTNEGDGIIENWMLDEELQAQKPALRFAFVNTADKSFYDGWGVVTSYSIEAPHDDVVTKSIEITGSGPITKRAEFSADTLPEESA